MAKPRLQKILISRTDAIGDVSLTLPVCVALKQQFPEAELVYLCRNYTAPVVACFEPIDDMLVYEELEALSNDERALKLEGFSAVLHLFPNKIVANWCKQARIPLRVGTAHRLHHWWTCNLLPWFSRKRSDLHEAQLNFYLAKAIGYPNIPNWIEIKQTSAFRVEDSLPAEFQSHDFSKVILLHPKSNGSGVEYPIEKYAELSLLLVEKGFEVFFTGTEKEGQLFRNQIPKNSKIKDVTGLWDLKTFISIISKSKALIACSTGPYHLAGLCQIQAIGLFTNTRPIHPGRWAALGTQSKALTEIETISPQQIADALQ
jgi:ADP-heptose:LPS heptosyltransferase